MMVTVRGLLPRPPPALARRLQQEAYRCVFVRARACCCVSLCVNVCVCACVASWGLVREQACPAII